MKCKKRYLLIICLCMSLNINAQWTMLHSFMYEDVCITDNNVGYTVGRQASMNKGVISKTIDNGNTWLPIYFHNNDLYSLSFSNSDVGYVVGQGGLILKTTDSGETWNSVQNPYSNQSTVKFVSVHFVDENIGFVISSSGAFLKTLDGGLNWTNSNIPHNGAFPLQEFCYIDANTYVIVGFQGKICKTIDGGLSWSEQVSNISSQINSVFFVNDSIGYCAAHSGKILKTINGGNNWTVMTLPLAVNNKNYYSIYFYNINEGIICGSDGVIISTTDGGLNWSIKQSGTNEGMLSICCSSQNICYIVGYSGLIVKSIDSGNNWSVINEGTFNQLYSVHFPSQNIGYACGQNGVTLKTSDGGYNWIKKNVVSNYNLNSIFFSDTLIGYTLGSTGGTSPQSIILKTTNGGATWSNWTGHLSGYKYDLETIYFINQSIGFAGGTIVNDNGGAYFILKTTDAGNTWQHISNINFMTKIKSFYFLDLQNGYAVGRSGRILKTVDGGVSWSLTVFPNFPNFN